MGLVKISELIDADAYDGNEKFPLLQNGNTRKGPGGGSSPIYNVLDFNSGLFSTPSQRAATIQAALNQVCSTGGTLDFPALAAVQDMTGQEIIWPEFTVFPKKHTYVELRGNGIFFSSTSAHILFKDNWPANNSVAVNRNVQRQIVMEGFNYIGAGVSTPGQAFCRLVGSYSPEFRHITVRDAYDGIDAVFCLNAVFRQCFGERNFNRTYWVRYGLDIDNADAPLWSGAAATNSNGNMVTFDHCEDYCRNLQTASFAIDGTDQVTLYKPIWEGEPPVNAVVYRTGSSTTTKSFSIIECHPENQPSNAHIKLVGSGGGKVIIEGGAFTQGLLMIDTSEFTTGEIHWHDQPFLAGKWKDKVASQLTWCFEKCGAAGVAPLSTPALWDGGNIPSYSYPVLRTTTNVAPENLGGAYPVIYFRGLGVFRSEGRFYFFSDVASPQVAMELPAAVARTMWQNPTNPATLSNSTEYVWITTSGKVLNKVVKEPGGTTFTSLDSYNHPPRYAGTGSPEGVYVAPVGSIYQRSDGGAGTCLYVKESGTGNTGWVAK